MSQKEISYRVVAPIRAAFRKRCHRLLAIGYNQALPRVRSSPDEETDITGYICEELDDWLRRHPKDWPCFFVKDDPPLRKSGKTGKRRSRTDIIIGFAAGRRPEFFFEAKRLHKTKAAAGRYTSDKGMGCFISGRYAGHCPEAGMLGYVQTGTPEEWQSKLHQLIKTKCKKLKLKQFDDELNFSEMFQLEWMTTHQRQGQEPINLYHILLDCCKQGNP